MKKLNKNIRRINRFGILTLVVMGVLGACGDDFSKKIPADYQLLGEPIGAENAGSGEQISVPDIIEGEKIPQDTESSRTTSQEESGIAGEDSGADDTDGIVDATGEATESNVVSITISAAGDVTLGNHQEQDYSYSFRQAYDQADTDDYFFENVYDVFSKDDMTLVNLEGVFTRSEEMQEGHTYNIKGDPEYANILAAGDVEAVGMANNHRQDYGAQGTKDTVAALENAGIQYAYDKNIAIYETKGIRIGYVSVNEVSWGVGVEKLIQDGIGKLQEEGADLILVSCHWGIERENYPEDYQRTLGRKCIDWGADLVVGHHPHVLQGIEEYQGKYIVYSLANFCFGANRNPEDKDTMIFQQTFTFVDGEKREDQEIRIIPCSVSSVKSRNDFKPTPLGGEDGQRVIGRINEYSKDYGVKFAEDGTLYDSMTNNWEPYKVKTYEATSTELMEEYVNDSKEITSVTYYEMSDGTWKTDQDSYKYKLELTGRLHNAEEDITYVILSNTKEITFDQAWKASGLSSNLADYFNSEETVIVGSRVG